MGKRFDKIKDVLGQKKYFLIFLAVSAIYFGAYVAIISFFLGKFSHLFTNYIKSYAYPALLLNIFVAVLLGLNVSLLVNRLRQYSGDKKSSLASSFGVFTAALANGCPGCFAGLFPMVLSIFGISATLSVLPFNGLELQVLSAGLLGMSIFFLTGETKNVCKVKK